MQRRIDEQSDNDSDSEMDTLDPGSSNTVPEEDVRDRGGRTRRGRGRGRGRSGRGRGRGRGVRGDRNTETNSIGKSYILYICRIFVNTYIHLQYGIVLDHRLMSNHSLDQLSHYQVIQLSCLVSSLQRKLYVKLFLKLTAMLHNVWKESQQHGKQMRRRYGSLR